MKTYQVPQTDAIQVEHLMETPGGSGGGPTPTTAPQRVNSQFTK